MSASTGDYIDWALWVLVAGTVGAIGLRLALPPERQLRFARWSLWAGAASVFLVGGHFVLSTEPVPTRGFLGAAFVGAPLGVAGALTLLVRSFRGGRRDGKTQ